MRIHLDDELLSDGRDVVRLPIYSIGILIL